MKRLLFISIIFLFSALSIKAQEDKKEIMVIPIPEGEEMLDSGAYLGSMEKFNVFYEREGNFLIRKLVKTDTVAHILFQEGVDNTEFTALDLKKMTEGDTLEKAKGIGFTDWFTPEAESPFAFYKMDKSGKVYELDKTPPKKSFPSGLGIWVGGVVLPFLLMLTITANTSPKYFFTFFFSVLMAIAGSVLVGSMLGFLWNSLGTVILSGLIGLIAAGVTGGETPIKREKDGVFEVAMKPVRIMTGAIPGGVAGLTASMTVIQKTNLNPSIEGANYILVFGIVCVLAFLLVFGIRKTKFLFKKRKVSASG